jgi:hypothetical protein
LSKRQAINDFGKATTTKRVGGCKSDDQSVAAKATTTKQLGSCEATATERCSHCEDDNGNMPWQLGQQQIGSCEATATERCSHCEDDNSNMPWQLGQQQNATAAATATSRNCFECPLFFLSL